MPWAPRASTSRHFATFVRPRRRAKPGRPCARSSNGLREPHSDWPAQLGWLRDWYEPHLSRLYDAAHVRSGDLHQLEQISANFPSRERFLSELTLDPPQSVGDEAGPPLLDEDFLILSTIHSAKGQEWDAVFVLNTADGLHPIGHGNRQARTDRGGAALALRRHDPRPRAPAPGASPKDVHPPATPPRRPARPTPPRTRFVPDSILDRFEQTSYSPLRDADEKAGIRPAVKVDVAARLRARWSAAGT